MCKETIQVLTTKGETNVTEIQAKVLELLLHMLKSFHVSYFEDE